MKILLLGLNFAPELTGIGKYTDMDGAGLGWAGLGLLCKDDIALPEFPQFSLRVAHFKGTTRDVFLDNHQYAGNAFALMRRAKWPVSTHRPYRPRPCAKRLPTL